MYLVTLGCSEKERAQYVRDVMNMETAEVATV